MKKRPLLLFLILPVLIIFIIAYHSFSQEKNIGSLTFSPEAWDTQPLNRMYMVGSLLEQYNGLKDMTKEDITELLGENAYYESREGYLVGRETSLEPGIFMTFCFDQNEVCSGFVIYKENGWEVLLQYETSGWKREK